MSVLRKSNKHKSSFEKYYINCNDPDKTLSAYKILDANFQRVITNAIQTEVGLKSVAAPRNNVLFHILGLT